MVVGVRMAAKKGKAEKIRQWASEFLVSHVGGNRAYQWTVVAVFLSVFVLIVRPLSLGAVDLWNRHGMTEQDRQESYGLPFPVSKPPSGNGHILNRDQLRWIFMQEIRMDAMKECLNHGNESAVREFMQLVDDYNMRGASYCCETADLRAAQQDIRDYREEIRQSAMAEAEALGWSRSLYDDGR